MKIEQLAINSISTRGELPDQLGGYADAGFKNVEFAIPQIKSYLGTGKSLADVDALLNRHGLKCIGGFETTITAFGDKAAREANHDLLVDNAKLLSDLGGSAMVVGTDGPGGAHDDPLGPIADALASVGERIADTGVAICVEFNWSPVIKSFRTAADVCKRAQRDNVRVLFDPAHYHCTPSKFEQLTAKSVPMIGHVHVDDMADKPGELSNCNADRELPGQGCLDLRAIFGTIEQHGYDGYFSIEMFSDRLWNMPPAAAAREMYESLLTLCD